MLGAVWRIPPSPKLQQPLGMGTPVLHVLHSLHCPGVQIGAMCSPSAPLSRPHPDCRSWTRCSPSSASSLAHCRLAVGGLAPCPLARSHPGPCCGRGCAAPSHGVNLLPLPVVLPGASAGGLPPLLPSLHCLQGSLFLQAGWVSQEQGAWGVRAAPGSGDGC